MILKGRLPDTFEGLSQLYKVVLHEKEAIEEDKAALEQQLRASDAKRQKLKQNNVSVSAASSAYMH